LIEQFGEEIFRHGLCFACTSLNILLRENGSRRLICPQSPLAMIRSDNETSEF